MLTVSFVLSVSFLIIGLVLKFFSSKNRETGYGYRTNPSISNEKSWKEGNGFSGRFLLYGSLLGIIICIGINYFLTRYLILFYNQLYGVSF